MMWNHKVRPVTWYEIRADWPWGMWSGQECLASGMDRNWYKHYDKYVRNERLHEILVSTIGCQFRLGSSCFLKDDWEKRAQRKIWWERPKSSEPNLVANNVNLQFRKNIFYSVRSRQKRGLTWQYPWRFKVSWSVSGFGVGNQYGIGPSTFVERNRLILLISSVDGLIWFTSLTSRRNPSSVPPRRPAPDERLK